MSSHEAPGKPGAKPHWASAAKTGVGTALGADSPLWFTLSHGIVTEVYYPFVDHPALLGAGFVVTDRKEFLSDELHDTESQVQYLAEGVPAFEIVNSCKAGRYQIEKTVLTDPLRPVLLQQIKFRPLTGTLADSALYVLVAPHLDDHGLDNSAWLDTFKGLPMLFAKRGGYALAVASSAPWLGRSAGFVGESDGRLDLALHKQLTWQYDRADHGNVLLTGEISLGDCDGQFVLAVGFGSDEYDAAHRARASLLAGFPAARKRYVEGWEEWQNRLLNLRGSKEHPQNICKVSAAVMRTHESKQFPGGIVASLAIPWGASKGDNDQGYHLVWPRDMIQTVGGLLAVRAHEDARRILNYLHVTQEADGHWSQNMYLNGKPSWNGIQLDETAFVILLVALAEREGALDETISKTLWQMVRQAAAYLVCHGPVSPLDRWEEEAGYFASTMAVEVAALVAAADLAERRGESGLSLYLRETADTWNAEIESLIYVTGTTLAREVGVEGYYVRFALPDQRMASTPAAGTVALKNHRDGEVRLAAAEIVSPDALTLVRFGLRAADDPRIVNTVRVIDHLLKVETPSGPSWHRYNEDGYGEHADGSPFDGTGIGRIWPLLTGERAHYELAAGRRDEAERLARALERFANESGLLSEQVWDRADIPEHQLHRGRPSGSAMPLVWAHAEYCKLRRSLKEGRVFDMPTHTAKRYAERAQTCHRTYWRFEQPCAAISANQTLRIELLAPARIHWTCDNWKTTQEVATGDTGLGIHFADLAADLRGHDSSQTAELQFTFYWLDAARWEGKNFRVKVRSAASPAPAARETGRQRSRA